MPGQVFLQGLAGGSQPLADTERARQLLGHGPVVLNRQPAVKPQRFGRDVGGHVRVAVPVPSHPGSEGKKALWRGEVRVVTV